MNILIETKHCLPVINYGGTERVVWALAMELTKMGHNVTLLAGKGTVCPFATVIERNPDISLHKHIPDYVDVVHYNSPADPLTTKPYIVTVHGNANHKNSNNNAVYVSKNHAHRFGSTHFVYNGLNWDEYGAVNASDLDKRGDYYHFLGKAAWRVKNVKGAISIINKVPKGKLMVLGGSRLNFKMGFRFTLSPKVSFKGMVDGKDKIEPLRHSKGLIFPVLWDEPFGLAITESLYFGSPVYGTPRGSLPELVSSEVGFLSNNETQIIEAVKNGGFSHHYCHQYATDLFNSRVMAQRYLDKYEIVMNHGKLL